ncbi:MAG: sigma-70 family RNA polymerase sigma factor [Planctomycetaceae bacterium]
MAVAFWGEVIGSTFGGLALASDAELQRLLDAARQHDAAARGALLEHFRQKLKAQVEQDLGAKILHRIGSSDVVQQTFFAALKAFDDFRGTQIPQFVVWLNQIHQRIMMNTLRFHRDADMRNVDRETVEDAASQPARLTTPSQKVIQQEEHAALRSLISELPDLQQQAIYLRYTERLKMTELAARMSVTEVTAKKLIALAVKSLRSRLGGDRFPS